MTRPLTKTRVSTELDGLVRTFKLYADAARRQAEDTLVTVCAECRTASCWYGEFMCDGRFSGADVIQVMRGVLAMEARESPHYWTDDAITNGGVRGRR